MSAARSPAVAIVRGIGVLAGVGSMGLAVWEGWSFVQAFTEPSSSITALLRPVALVALPIVLGLLLLLGGMSALAVRDALRGALSAPAATAGGLCLLAAWSARTKAQFDMGSKNTPSKASS